ncbi:hypothetical protein [Desulfoscipio geothermicus]|uniref:Uncharacterized protein n=1 Tax=Desulfoscipio geothermicus DSM 3669 TaxID=1121426 RepID=A0A1I6E762_9FIRM|nr:hypothetical protein [Desulfoscipio geothermicus]SFR13348.1 hypothetical protein SAMN05660706_12742 [Desulfoscipio geothermicus DSM 3669]
MENNTNPFTLFLILILLILSTDKQADIKLGFVRGLIDQTARSLSTIREGIEAMNTGFEHARVMFTGPDNDHGETK